MCFFTYLFVHLFIDSFSMQEYHTNVKIYHDIPILDLEPNGLKHPQASSSQVAKIFLLLHQPQASPAMPYEVS